MFKLLTGRTSGSSKVVDLPSFRPRFESGSIELDIDELSSTVSCLDQAELRLRELLAGLPASYFKDLLGVAHECVRDGRGPLSSRLGLARQAHDMFYGGEDL